jgi:hypothetical protein
VVAWIAVSIVTLGSGIVAWIVYHFIIRDMLLPTVVVEAYPTEVSGGRASSWVVLRSTATPSRSSWRPSLRRRGSRTARNSALYALHAPHPLSGWGVLYAPTA